MRRVGADHLCSIRLAIIGSDLNLLRILHDVIVRHGIAVPRNEKARALSDDYFMPLRRARRAKAFEETLKWRARWKWQLVLAEAGFSGAINFDSD